jgi:uncharacterized protein with ParB-like and HNH nuclease domain
MGLSNKSIKREYKMVANSSKIQEFLSQPKTQFIIPVYQRNYDWTIGQCKQLLDDIMIIGNNTAHFIGSIVYIHDNIYTSTNIKELVIIDGQQRLTTIMLIYVVLYRLARRIDNYPLLDEINETYLINKFVSNTEKLKLRLTENNDKAFHFLLSNEPMSEYPEFSNIIENFNYINGRINQDNYEFVLKGLSKLIFVEISLERGKDDPQRIFESLNSTGLELSQADLIRNYMLMGLKHEDQQRIYNTYWKFIEKNARILSSNESKVSDFIQDYLTLENKKIPNKNKVYIEFKTKYPLQFLGELEIILSKMKQFVRHYNKLINPESEPDKGIREEIKFINRLESVVAYPFLLQIYDDYTNNIIDKSIFIEILNVIQSFVWRRFITGLPTNALNKIFMNLYEKVDKNDYLYSIQLSLMQRTGAQRFPNNEEVIDALHFKDMYNVNSRNIHYLLEKLENFDNHEKVIIQGNSDMTIEHIFPQNPDISWGKILNREDYDNIREKYLHTISNLTLSGNNGKLGNMSFQDKKNLKNYGYKDSRLWLNKYLASINNWNIPELEERFDLIKDRFLEIWKYPKVQSELLSSEGEINIFQAEDPTGKTFDYVIFRDEKRKITTASELYTEIVRQLLELQPNTFFSTDLANSIVLTRKETKNELRGPLKVNDTWFIEGKLSNIDKFKKIKYILSIFDLEDDLIIKYA